MDEMRTNCEWGVSEASGTHSALDAAGFAGPDSSARHVPPPRVTPPGLTQLPAVAASRARQSAMDPLEETRWRRARSSLR